MTIASPTLSVDGIQVPQFMYGTAWKEDKTQSLVETSLRQGFRAIDTANQRRHYHEAAVGLAIQAVIKQGLVKREELFLQTKFTFQRSQDHRLPYDPKASVSIQVEQSFASSLEHLGVERIDSYVLHGPTSQGGLMSADWDAWRTMEAIHDSGRTRLLGISNVSLQQLQQLYRQARIKPRFVQNRCYATLAWDHRIREFCAANHIIYQGFSLLTANRDVLAQAEFLRIAKKHRRSVNQIVFRFAIDSGMLPLTGTTNANHMREDLGIFDFQLDPAEVRQIEIMATPSLH